jgi:hypothetical protein
LSQQGDVGMLTIDQTVSNFLGGMYEICPGTDQRGRLIASNSKLLINGNQLQRRRLGVDTIGLARACRKTECYIRRGKDVDQQ